MGKFSDSLAEFFKLFVERELQQTFGLKLLSDELLAAITVPSRLVSILLVPNSDSNSLYGPFLHCAGIELFIFLTTLGTIQN